VKLLGLDVGTTTICGIVIDVVDGRITFVHTESNASSLPARNPWESAQDPDAAVRIARLILEKAAAAHPDIRGIGISSQMHGVLYVDSTGNAVSPLFTWQDGRGDLPFDGGTYASFVSSALGQQAATGMGTVTHFANLQLGLTPNSAAFLCTVGDYLAMKLTGRRSPLMDTTCAASISGFDLEKLSFMRPHLKAMGCDPSLFPEVTSEYPSLGEYGPDIPVFPALGDNQASFLGATADKEHMASVNVGTGSQISVFVSSFRRIDGIDLRPLPFGGYIGVGAGLCGGRAYAVLREFFQKTVLTLTGRQVEIAWDSINDLSPSDETEPLRVDTRFSGTRVSPSVRGSISNIGLANLTPEHLASGFRDGIVSELLEFYRLFDITERERINSIVGSGNAIRLNTSLRHAFEKGFQLTLRVPGHREEAAFGAALVAGVASGIFPDLASACALVRY
jgi:sedoheptulokinase